MLLDGQHRVIHHEPVLTCAAAAVARGIPLRCELKTLLMMVRHGRIAVHLRASDRLSSRSIRSVLRTQYTRFLTTLELREAGFQPGTVNPWSVPLDHYHLLCASVLDLPTVATNAGTLTTGVLFRPELLLKLPRLVLGRFGVT
jgi:prolyl-tRNA editing enzyme YbaK/EbsC (Cys-tRNA(Pro) deacylase)